jgi:hypothetical protein
MAQDQDATLRRPQAEVRMSAETKLDLVHDRLTGPWATDAELNESIRRAANISSHPIQNASVAGVRQTLIGFGLIRRGKDGVGWVKGPKPVPLTAEQKAEMARPRTVEWQGPPRPKPVRFTYEQMDEQTKLDVETILRFHQLI